MSETLEGMERRLIAVERELADIRARLRLLTSGEEARAGRNPRLLDEARGNQAALAVTAQEVFAALGISSESVEVEAAQQRMLADGVRPEDNAFSRGIIEIREE